jgi:hypothetical protein
MKLVQQSSKRQFIGTQWERKTNTWGVHLSDTEFDDRIRSRFKEIEVEQYWDHNEQVFTSFRGTRTNWFGPETKDKQKRLIIDAVTKFINNDTHALVAQWSEQSAHN